MFVVDSARDSLRPANRQQEQFFSGYGAYEVDPLALAYYRYEWVVQEIGDYGERLLLNPRQGEATKADSLDGMLALFQSGDVVESAYQADKDITQQDDIR
jgi:spectinomycin phosphotransferase